MHYLSRPTAAAVFPRAGVGERDEVGPGLIAGAARHLAPRHAETPSALAAKHANGAKFPRTILAAGA